MWRGWQWTLAAALVAGIVLGFWWWRTHEQALVAPGGRAGNRLNVILVSIDTLRADHLGCYGYAQHSSPTIDRLAREGVLFEECVAQAPWTLPSHMSLFTSLYPSYHRVEDISERLPNKALTLAEALKDRGYRTAALVNNGEMRDVWGFDQGFDEWREFEVLQPEGSCENITEEVCKWLRKQAGAGDGSSAGRKPQDAKPFFLFIHYFDCHDPYDPGPKYERMFSPDYHGAISSPVTPEVLAYYKSPDRQMSEEERGRLVALYDGEIRRTDDSLSTIVALLGETRLQANTLLVIISDHGEEFEEHLSTTHGATLYDEVLHVPWIMLCPGVLPAGRRVKGQVELIDVFPTILALLGLPEREGLQGESRAAQIEGERVAGASFARSETKRALDGKILKCLRTEEYKYVYSWNEGSEELYHLPTDAGEKRNLVEEKPEITSAFRAEMRRWVNETEDFWELVFQGDGKSHVFSGRLEAKDGKFGPVVPIGFREDDSWSPSEDGKMVKFDVHTYESVSGLYLETLPPDTPVRLVVDLDGQPAPESVRIEQEFHRTGGGEWYAPKAQPGGEPFRLGRPSYQPGQKLGCSLRRYQAAGVRSAQPAEIGRKTWEELRRLGYVGPRGQ